MVTLVADRFLQLAEDRAVDLATGEAVVLRTADSILGAAAQQAWTDACAARLGEHEAHTLIDFGLVGSAGRFEAYRARALVQPLPMPLADVAIAREAVQQAIDWLEDAKAHSPRILYAMGAGCRWLEQLARAIRLHGFIPLNVSLAVRLQPDHCRRFSGRAVVLLELRQDLRSGAELASAIVTAAIADAREIAAIVHVPPDGKNDRGLSLQATLGNAAFWPRSAAGLSLVARAAESRSVYGSRGKPALLVDSRGMHLLDEARQWASRGRHAAAERAARAALAAFDRRDDLLHAGDGAMLLGRLLLDRGRAAEARTHFDTARDKFQQLGGADSAVRACVFSGLAQTDEARIEQAERTLRSAYSAASALQDAEAIQMAGIALARNMYWQQRYDGARTLLEELGCDQLVVRYWCLMSRLGLAIGNVEGASQCAGRARDAAGESPDAPAEAIIRLAHVRIQATLGDVDALGVHMRAGLAAARAAHLPLAALKMRVAFFEGLLNAGQVNRARAAMSRAKMVRRPFLPPLLKQRLDRLVERVSRADETGQARPLVSSVHETAPSFPIGHIDRVTELLAVCHDVEDERRALSAAAIAVRNHTGALATGIFGATDAGASPCGVAGTIAPGTARRAIDLTYAISPESAASGVEAAVPIQHLGRTIGAMACRWSVEGPRRADDVLGFMRLGAAACAPLVQIVLARDCMPLQETAGALELIGSSTGIDDVRRLIARAANAGESGSGKELVARAIHSAGCRRERIFCALNCAALTEELVDAELFGHVKGAFTGAATDRLGLFESADQGTVFLDEVGELSSRAQAKLLRVLQEGEIRRVGENFTRPIDARLVAATNRPLKAEVEAGRFRQDLLYRLDVIRIAVPPLRERVDDIPLLASRFWKQATDRIGSKAVLGPGAFSALARYDWPGNVRELQNVLTALAVSVPSRGIVGPAAMPAVIAHATRTGARETLDAARRGFEERFVRAALARSAGHRGQTAAALGVSRQGLAKLMQRLQI